MTEQEHTVDEANEWFIIGLCDSSGGNGDIDKSIMNKWNLADICALLEEYV